MITAIVLVGLVGVVVLAMTALLAADARRTHEAQTQAQLHELLRIAAAHAQQQLAENRQQPQEVIVELPPVLREDDVSLRYTIAHDGPTATATITAAHGDAVARQTVLFIHDDNRWQMRQATLE